jgi:hypothetical protein
MTHLDQSNSAAAVQRTAILDRLRRVGEAGASEAEMVAAGGMWWRTRLKEIRRWRLAVIGEQDGRFYLVSVPDVESCYGGSRDDAVTPGSSSPSECATSVAALSTEPLVLFPSGSSHYREAA